MKMFVDVTIVLFFSCQRSDQKLVLIIFFQDDDRSLEFFMLSILLSSNVNAQARPPHLAYIERGRKLSMVKLFLHDIPPVEIFQVFLRVHLSSLTKQR